MKKIDRYFYPAVFTYASGEIRVFFPDLDISTKGRQEKDTLIAARELLGCKLYELEESGELIPLPSALVELETGEKECVVLVDVYMPAIRMANISRSVRRTVTLPAWLNAAALENDINFSQVLQEALKAQLGLK